MPDASPLVGAVSRESKECFVESVENLSAALVHPILKRHIAVVSKVYTDEHGTYLTLAQAGFDHEMIAHRSHEWVRDGVHTNTAENRWSFWRAFSPPHRGFSEEHLPLWTGWFAWGFNHRSNGLTWLKNVFDTAVKAPGRDLRQIMAERMPPALCPVSACQGTVVKGN